MLPLRGRELLVIDHVHLGLREHHTLGGLIDLGIDAVSIVAVQDANRLQPLHTQLLPQLAAQALGLYIKARSLLGITAVNTHVHSSTRYPNSFLFYRPLGQIGKHISLYRAQILHPVILGQHCSLPETDGCDGGVLI